MKVSVQTLLSETLFPFKMRGDQRTLISFQMFCFLLVLFVQFQACFSQYHFVVKEARYKRLCHKKKILTVNGQYPGPTIYARKGDTIYVTVYNEGKDNITLHWHGVKLPRYPWSDGPEYITQCPIKPGGVFRQKVIFSTEEGTLWWHAHSAWYRATVHGAIIVYPKEGKSYPFPQPYEEVPIILGEWWKKDIKQVYDLFLRTGGDPNVSNALTINGQPGDLYHCSRSKTFKLAVDEGKSYLLRFVNAAMNIIFFFSIANHNLTVVGIDGSYTKPFSTDIIVISPGQTLDALLYTDQNPNHRYYMAGRAYASNLNVSFDNTTTTAILEYKKRSSCNRSSSPLFPYLPYYNDTNASFSFFGALRSLVDEEHPIYLPLNTTTNLVSTISINTLPCELNNSCEGPNGTRLAASMNNISFVLPSVDILEAYYYHIHRVFSTNFPSFPAYVFNYTADYLPLILQIPKRGTRVKVLRYNSAVEVVFQGTNIVAGIDHPMHLHGYSFYVVGFGYGNFNESTDPLNYNLVDPPRRNTATVPINGWLAIRFFANNPGVWFIHCHFERHLTWGMETVFIVRNGKKRGEKILPPPPDMPPC